MGRRHVDPVAPAAAIAGYDDVRRTSGASVAYETYLALAVDLRYTRADIAAAGGGDLGAAAAALRQMRTLAQEVPQAGLTLTGWLSLRELGEALRVAFDPAAVGLTAQRRVDHDLEPGVDLADAGPVAGAGPHRHVAGGVSRHGDARGPSFAGTMDIASVWNVGTAGAAAYLDQRDCLRQPGRPGTSTTMKSL